MKGISFVQESKLSNVCGRINYISSEEKQENLYAVYETAPIEFWQSLGKECQDEFKRFGTNGRCIEAREFVIALPAKFYNSDHDLMLKHFTEKFKSEYNVECISALHHNKSRRNLHIHLIFSERRKLQEPIEKIATRTMYYTPEGKRVRTKKEATNDKGELLPGYTIVPKGEAYERHEFGPKDPMFKSKEFTHNAKEFFTEIMNNHLNEYEQLVVFPKGTPYLPTKKIGKNNPRAREIAYNNALKDEWNDSIRAAGRMGASKERMEELKRVLIVEPLKKVQEVPREERTPEKIKYILSWAIGVIRYMLYQIGRMARVDREDAWGKSFEAFLAYCKEHAKMFDLERAIRERNERSR